MNLLFYFSFYITIILTASCNEIRSVKVSAIEEDGIPIKDVDTTITFLGYSGSQTQRINGKTDASGVFMASGKPQLRMYARLEKDGYYPTQSDRLPRTQDHDLTFLLRRVKNPIPLYAKKIRMGFPVNRQWIGFDFEAGDWVAPHGIGKSEDVLFRCDTEKTGEKDGKGSLEIKFAEDDGMLLVSDDYDQFSGLKLPHFAPENKYIRMHQRIEDSYHNKNFTCHVGYFFKTRTVKDNEKNSSANYGKILTDFRFSPRHFEYDNKPKKFATVSFTYYFNPIVNNRNLEFDIHRNLFGELDPTEQVHEP